MSAHWLFSTYAGVARVAAPAIRRHIEKRAERGKEDPARLGERFGRAGLPRPHGPLVWIHGASIGETLSALPLIAAIRDQRPAAQILMTSGTVTSAEMIARRAPDVIHQYVPVDTPAAVRGFLDHWRPDLGLWVESEFWPTLVLNAARQCPIALVNARLSARSAKRWAMVPRAASALIGSFAVRAAQSDAIRGRLVAIGAPDDDTTVTTGSLKASRFPDLPDPDALANMRAVLGERRIWLAASTHPGEEELVLAAHVARGGSDLMTIIAPRHPERGAEIAALAQAQGLSVARRALGEAPQADVYIADTLGEMPLWYALAPLAYLGGGMGGLGGHNPIELAQAGVAVLAGPDTANAAEDFARLEAAGALRFVNDGVELSEALKALLPSTGPAPEVAAMRSAALAQAAPDLRPVKATMAALQPLLARL